MMDNFKLITFYCVKIIMIWLTFLFGNCSAAIVSHLSEVFKEQQLVMNSDV